LQHMDMHTYTRLLGVLLIQTTFVSTDAVARVTNKAQPLTRAAACMNTYSRQARAPKAAAFICKAGKQVTDHEVHNLQLLVRSTEYS
jgi:hypothetical protein